MIICVWRFALGARYFGGKIMPSEETPACRSRRSFLQLSAAAAAAATVGFPIVTEPMLAHAESHPYPKDAVLINANENPHKNKTKK